jgi:ribosomal protein L11 methyltransferase
MISPWPVYERGQGRVNSDVPQTKAALRCSAASAAKAFPAGFYIPLKTWYIYHVYEWVFIYEFEGNLSLEVSALAKDEDYIGFWREADYSFLFFKKEKLDWLESRFPPCRSRLVIRHEDWESGQILDLLQLETLTIHPPWKAPPSQASIPVCIDPGMAFGSGYHASTKGCLVLLERLFRQWIPPRVLDLGTGTGILSIAALKKGAAIAFAVDENNLAMQTAKKNRRCNRLEDRLHLLQGNVLDFLYIPANLLLANIHYAVIDRMTDHESFYEKNYYIVAGLIGHEGYEIEQKVEKRLRLLDRVEENFWFSYLFQSKT